MGMFDDIKCDMPLPNGFTGQHFQSKDLDCCMDSYHITAGGRLLKRYVDRVEPVSEDQWEHVGATDPLRQIWHEQSKTKKVYAWRDTNFHGMLNFYTHEGSMGDGTWKWHEYNAKFTDGQLVEITQVPDEEQTDA